MTEEPSPVAAEPAVGDVIARADFVTDRRSLGRALRGVPFEEVSPHRKNVRVGVELQRLLTDRERDILSDRDRLRGVLITVPAQIMDLDVRSLKRGQSLAVNVERARVDDRDIWPERLRPPQLDRQFDRLGRVHVRNHHLDGIVARLTVDDPEPRFRP